MDKKKEQAKVRDKILKVFKARAQSPGGGPAIIVNDGKHQARSKGAHSHIKNDEFPKYKLEDSDDFLLSDDANASPVTNAMETTKHQSRKTKHQHKEENTQSMRQENETKMNSRGHSGSKKKSHQREKRRKSRTERNNQRAQKQQQVNPHEREEFRKHVKRGREVTSQSKHNESNSDDQVFVAITQNRLTRQSGIYNQGKKSSRLYRDPLRVSERVTAAVEEDVKMIVDKPGSPGLHHTSSMELIAAATRTPVLADRRTRSSSRSGKSLRSISRKRNTDSGGAKKLLSRSADCPSSDEQSTPVLDVQDLSVQLMKSLDVRHLFPGTDYGGEIKCELHKLMKSNWCGREIKISAQSVRQCLQSPKHKTETKSSEQQQSPHPITRRGTPATQTVSAPIIQHATACIQPQSAEADQYSQDRVLLMEVPQGAGGDNQRSKPLISLQGSRSPTKPSSSTFTDNALELLHFAETAHHELSKQGKTENQCPVTVNQPPYSVSMADELGSDYYSGEFSNGLKLKRTSGDVTQHERVRVEKQVDMYDDKALSDIWHSDTLLERRLQRTGYDHDDRWYDDDYDTRYSGLHHERSSTTDMLDHIDVDQMEVTGPSPSLPELLHYSYKQPAPERLSHRHYSRPHLPHTITKFQESASDSDSSSPVWRPAFNVSPMKKPQLDTPGPPELYPQKMF